MFFPLDLPTFFRQDMGKKTNQQRSVARTIRRALEADVEQGHRQAENQCNQQGLEEEAAHT